MVLSQLSDHIYTAMPRENNDTSSSEFPRPNFDLKSCKFDMKSRASSMSAVPNFVASSLCAAGDIQPQISSPHCLLAVSALCSQTKARSCDKRHRWAGEATIVDWRAFTCARLLPIYGMYTHLAYNGVHTRGSAGGVTSPFVAVGLCAASVGGVGACEYKGVADVSRS